MSTCVSKIIKEKLFVISVGGRTFRYREVIEELIQRSEESEIIDLTMDDNDETTTSTHVAANPQSGHPVASPVYVPSSPVYSSASPRYSSAYSSVSPRYSPIYSPTSPLYTLSSQSPSVYSWDDLQFITSPLTSPAQSVRRPENVQEH